MREFTQSQELALECRNKIAYAKAILEFAAEKKRPMDEKEIRLALDGLREAAKILSEIARL